MVKEGISDGECIRFYIRTVSLASSCFCFFHHGWYGGVVLWCYGDVVRCGVILNVGRAKACVCDDEGKMLNCAMIFN